MGTEIETDVNLVFALSSLTADDLNFALTSKGAEDLNFALTSEDDDWEEIGNYSWNSNKTSALWTENAGDYRGRGGGIQLSLKYSQVRLEAISGAWDDDTTGVYWPPDKAWRCCLGVVTAVASGCLGGGGSYSLGTQLTLNEEEANSAFSGNLTLDLGDDGYVCWGCWDTMVSNNAGSVFFKVYAKK